MSRLERDVDNENGTCEITLFIKKSNAQCRKPNETDSFASMVRTVEDLFRTLDYAPVKSKEMSAMAVLSAFQRDSKKPYQSAIERFFETYDVSCGNGSGNLNIDFTYGIDYDKLKVIRQTKSKSPTASFQMANNAVQVKIDNNGSRDIKRWAKGFQKDAKYNTIMLENLPQIIKNEITFTSKNKISMSQDGGDYMVFRRHIDNTDSELYDEVLTWLVVLGYELPKYWHVGIVMSYRANKEGKKAKTWQAALSSQNIKALCKRDDVDKQHLLSIKYNRKYHNLLAHFKYDLVKNNVNRLNNATELVSGDSYEVYQENNEDNNWNFGNDFITHSWSLGDTLQLPKSHQELTNFEAFQSALDDEVDDYYQHKSLPFQTEEQYQALHYYVMCKTNALYKCFKENETNKDVLKIGKAYYRSIQASLMIA